MSAKKKNNHKKENPENKTKKNKLNVLIGAILVASFGASTFVASNQATTPQIPSAASESQSAPAKVINGVNNLTKNGVKVVEGVHYKKLESPVDVEGLAEESVLEIFWLGCPHCQNFEKGVRTWKDTKPKSLQLKKMHAVTGNPRWTMDAHIFTAFNNLSKGNEKVIEGLFDLYINQFEVYKKSVALNKNTPVKPYPNIKLISDYAIASGITADEFTDAFESDEVKSQVKHDGSVFKDADLQGVPAFIVNKQYLITGVDAKSFEDYFQIVEKVSELTKK